MCQTSIRKMEDSSASHKCGRRTFTLHRIQGGQHELDVVDGVHQPVAVRIPVADSIDAPSNAVFEQVNKYSVWWHTV